MAGISGPGVRTRVPPRIDAGRAHRRLVHNLLRPAWLQRPSLHGEPEAWVGGACCDKCHAEFFPVYTKEADQHWHAADAALYGLWRWDVVAW
jgi:hypothetical protein